MTTPLEDAAILHVDLDAFGQAQRSGAVSAERAFIGGDRAPERVAA